MSVTFPERCLRFGCWWFGIDLGCENFWQRNAIPVFVVYYFGIDKIGDTVAKFE